MRLDAALCEPAPRRKPGQIGRPRVKGQRLPTLKHLLCDPKTHWFEVSVAWYDGTTRKLQIASETALSQGQSASAHSLGPDPPLGELEPQALLCADPCVEHTQIIEWFVLRWQLEVTFQEARAHIGVETQRQWSDKAIARATPALGCSHG